MPNDKGVLVTQEKQLPVMADPHMKLIEMCVNNGGDIVQLEKLMDLQERYENNIARKAFFESFSCFQSELPEIVKTGKVGYENKDGSFTGYKHSTLADIGKAVSPVLSKHGLSYRFKQLPRTDPKDQSITIVCILSHKLGHEESTQMSGFADASGKKNAIQAIASTRTYMQRYTVTDILGLTFVEEDDDGAGGSEEAGSNCNMYSEEDFDNNLPKWEIAIKAGKKTPDAVVSIINKNGFTLTESQLTKIYGVK